MARNTRSKALSHPPIFTVGHGTRTLDDLIQLLQAANVTKLVDVRSIPRSFTNPQFNRDTLQESSELRSARIEYVWFGASLGGRRNAKQPTLEQHTAIRVAAFRNYAGYMSTPSFKEGLSDLQHLAEELHRSSEGHVAIMCSETLWWRCHRRMVSDALVVEGWNVQHVGVGKKTMEHTLWDIARVHEGKLVYDGRRHTKQRKTLPGEPAASEKWPVTSRHPAHDNAAISHGSSGESYHVLPSTETQAQESQTSLS